MAKLIATMLFLAVAGAGTARAQSSASEETLYERLGGLPAISLLISDFMDDFAKDELILANPAVRERKTPDKFPYIKFQVTALLCEAAGGPCRYTGLDLRTAHDGLNVSQAEWDRMVEIFSATLTRHNVPEQEQGEIFAILGPSHADIVVSSR